MDAIITAGGTPLPGEPLYPYTLGGNKAMLDVAGQPMIQWVVQAISQSKNIDHIIISGINQTLSFTCPKPFTVLPNEGDMLANIQSAAKLILHENPSAEAVLVVASDIPAITTEMVDWMVDQINAFPADLYYNTISRTVMETKYPESRRTYVRLQDTEICGGDMNAINLRVFKNARPVWQDLIGSRKSPLKQASIIGLDLLIRVLLRRITLADAVELISRRLGIVGKAIVCPYAEVGMDVDKPHQLELMKKDLMTRKGQ
jgi:GTP:adenosylcobinamide-phosphate guanylyltransferase